MTRQGTCAKTSWRLRARGPYDLRVAVHGHGWYDLAPHAWDEAAGSLTTTLAIDAQRAVDVAITGVEDGVAARVESAQRLTRDEGAHLRGALRRILRLDVDLTAFWTECARHERLAWVPKKRAGHLMQSATLFEDLLRILFTTNCSWAATRLMCARTIDALGPCAPSGRRAFPSAATCAAQPESFWRDVVRTGYRAKSCRLLAEAFASGVLDAATFEDPALGADELRKRLLALPGFGPYAVGHALRGLGHFEDLALDSWCRARMATLLGRKRPPSDRWFATEYARFSIFRGLALWMDLTAEWHGR
ncbi:MAG: Fe-S cluster assembly protein HesB [Planctomycetes bacterium]|nr:Fe-S cluster assembly protein HesB [Planctomycetota bacterium]